MSTRILLWLCTLFVVAGCEHALPPEEPSLPPPRLPRVVYGAEVLVGSDSLLAHLRGKRLGLVANHTSRVFDRHHLADTLLALGLDLRRVFAPEHGFRGQSEAGDSVDSGHDAATGLEVFSLYGTTKKPTAASLADIDILIFDIQDVGTRFYTYLTTLGLVQAACAETGTALWVLDRPNPNGHAVAGPVLQPCWQSFVGAERIPILHGLTLGEYARLLNGEGWLPKKRRAALTVIPLQNWWHDRSWEAGGRAWVAPSPNLPTPRAARWYAGLCWFEGTQVSVGRGTSSPFERVGYPGLDMHSVPHVLPWAFVPRSAPGKATDPLHMDQPCSGGLVLGAGLSPDTVLLTGLRILARAHAQYPRVQTGWRALGIPSGPFFNPLVPTNPWFEKLTGGPGVRRAIEAGQAPEAILASWQPGVYAFERLRRPYLLYPLQAPDTPPLPEMQP